MDELLRDFLTETNESIDVVDVELVRFEHEPNNAKILDNIFRLVHTIKGTCGFLGLPRLEALTHAAETLMGHFRDGVPVTSDAVSLILTTIDRIKMLLDRLERNQAEEPGEDRDLIAQLGRMAAGASSAKSLDAAPARVPRGASPPSTASGDASLEELERAFSETPGPPPPAAASGSPAPAVAPAVAAAGEGGEGEAASHEGERSNDRIAAKSIRVHVDTLEHLMTMVSELVLTRNQLL